MTEFDRETESVHSAKLLHLTDIERQAIAREVARVMKLHPNCYSELNLAIDTVQKYGVDEVLYIYDILHPQNSVFIHSSNSVANLQSVVNESHLVEACQVGELQYYGHLQLYWPYHTNWDVFHSPIIIFEPTSESVTTVQGYKALSSGEIVSVTLDVRTLDQDTNESFIIIKQSEYSYTRYPNFKNGEFEKNGRIWLTPFHVEGQDGEICYENHITGSDTIVEATCYKFKSSGTQYDSWFFGGGSEFAITVARINEGGIADTTVYAFELSRKDICDHASKNIYFPFHFNWQRNFGPIYYYFREEDAGGTESEINFSLAYQGSSVSATIKKKSSDHLLGSGHIPWATFIGWCQSGENDKVLGGGEKFYLRTILRSTPEL